MNITEFTNLCITGDEYTKYIDIDKIKDSTNFRNAKFSVINAHKRKKIETIECLEDDIKKSEEVLKEEIEYLKNIDCGELIPIKNDATRREILRHLIDRTDECYKSEIMYEINEIEKRLSKSVPEYENKANMIKKQIEHQKTRIIEMNKELDILKS